MYLQRLEIQGFKSFAHKTVFIFPKKTAGQSGITAVVGPNGSGKSNVADAMRWVLGEQSMKLLRSKKSEDVIFFGSDTKSQLGFCEVSLFFDNQDKVFQLDYAEVVITRRLYRSGESDYLINGAKVRLTDVVLLLAQAHCGQRSYSVIGQGMIDSLVTMSATERKSFFDEAAGVRQYQIKKDAAQNKLKTTRDNISQAQLLITELEPKIKFFQRQLKRLEERGALEEQLQGLLREYYGAAWASLNEQKSAYQKSLDDIQHELDSKIAEHAVFSAEFQSYEQKTDTKASSRMAEIRREHDELSRKRSAILSRLSLLDARLSTEYERKGEANISFALQRAGELDAKRQSYLEEQEGMHTESERLASVQNALSQQLESLERVITETEEMFTAQSPVQEHITLDRIQAALHALQEEKNFFFSEGTTEQEVREALQRLFTRLDELVAAIEASSGKPIQNTTIKAELEGYYQEKRRLASELQDVRVRMGVIIESGKRLTKAITDADLERERITQELAYFSSTDSNEAQKSLEKEKQALVDERGRVEQQLAKLKKEIDTAYAEQSAYAATLLRIQNTLTQSQKTIDTIRSKHTATSLDRAKCEAHQDELFAKMCDELGLTIEQQETLRGNEYDLTVLGIHYDTTTTPLPDMRKGIDAIKHKLEQIGSIDQEAVAEYESTKERFEFLTNQSADLSASIESLERGIAELEHSIKDRFQSSLSIIEEKFNQYFQQLFNGGRAQIVLLKASDCVSESEEEEADGEREIQDQLDTIVGIDISAMPPGKKLKNMSVLSGGEKALTAIALICAVVSHNPSPFVVLDEVDAALDESNANRFATIIRELSEKTQFIVITHNRATIHTAQCMYGVTMGEDGISRVLSLDIANSDDTLNEITKS